MGMKEYTETGHGRGIRQQTVFNLYSSEDQNNLKLESELLLRRFPSQQPATKTTQKSSCQQA